MKIVTFFVALVFAVTGAVLFFSGYPPLVYSSLDNPCAVDGAKTILCIRTEDKDAVYYKTIVESSGEQIVIFRKTLKWKWRGT